MVFPNIKQLNKFECGLTCLRMVLKYYKVEYTASKLRNLFSTSSSATSLLEISTVANNLGFATNGLRLSIDDLAFQKLPCILHWENKHFVVLHKVKNRIYTVSDPGPGLNLTYSYDDFKKKWVNNLDAKGNALILEPTDKLKVLRTEERKQKINFILLKYVIPFRAYYMLILVGMGIGLSLSFITPFLTKAVVDIGIKDKSISFINLILLAQFMTALSTISLSLLRNWIFLYMGWKMNFSAITDFLTKVLKMPISYFDSSQVGDILQRINDHYTLKSFVSSSTFNIAFSFVNVIVFGGILAYYNLLIFSIFVVSSLLYILWVTRFMKKRKEFDYQVFDKNALNQNKLLQIFSGIKDIKLHNFEQQSKREWVNIQAELFKVNEKQMVISQYQQIGSFLIDISKTLIISYFTAKLVIKGEMTLGMMLSVQYILGQLNLPIAQFIGFNNSLQDAKISIERIGEVYDRTDEDAKVSTYKMISGTEDILFKNLNYTYPKTGKPVLKNINLTIPKGKITAIVGSSGSGKTTIIKLLLRFYNDYEGSISLNGKELRDISLASWRESCASVLQDGFVFNESIMKNIGFGNEEINMDAVQSAANMANIHDHIMTLPDGYMTTLGTEINNLSQGQKQRILIARSIYKNSDYIFLDEPTAALDSENEKIIMDNLYSHYIGKTIIVIAHRISTIINADQIVLIEKGEISAIGRHQELLINSKKYIELFKN